MRMDFQKVPMSKVPGDFLVPSEALKSLQDPEFITSSGGIKKKRV